MCGKSRKRDPEMYQTKKGNQWYHGIGVKNVNDRIKIYFGDKYGIKVRSELDEGTCVTIRIPKITE